MIVVDANVVCVALYDDGRSGHIARTRLRGESLVAPALIDVEVVSVLRGRAQAGALTAHRAEQALADLEHLPLARVPHRPLLARCWELRDNVSPYDAAYVALAEILGAALLTGDRRLARATGPRCTVEVVPTSA